MPRRSSSPERKPPSSSDEDKPDTKPDLKPNPTPSPKPKRGGRIDATSRAALAAAVIQRGVAAALAEIDTVSNEVSCANLRLS